MSFVIKLKKWLYSWKQWLGSVFVYPKMGERDEKYEKYWEKRLGPIHKWDRSERQAQSRVPFMCGVNSFQKKRAKMAAKYIEPDSVVMDIGCGNGGTLLHINERKPLKKMIGVDFSLSVLAAAHESGIETIAADISKPEELVKLPAADYILLFEVLEHLPNSEEVLSWAANHARNGVFFSVPNTGFFTHRLRLLLGRFPLQWRVRPSEHLRFWTVCDMKWWLKQLGYHDYILKPYEGPSILNRLWSSFFAQGIWVYLQRTDTD